MKISWARIITIALIAELLIFSIYCLIIRYAGSLSRPIKIAYGFSIEPLALLNFFVLMFLAGLWVTRRIRSRSVLHGALVGVAACLVYLIYNILLIMKGNLPYDYGIGALQSFVVKIPAGALGGYFGRQLIRRSPRPYA
jgi:hypothetical protein